jgi:hypothetical protein
MSKSEDADRAERTNRSDFPYPAGGNHAGIVRMHPYQQSRSVNYSESCTKDLATLHGRAGRNDQENRKK